MDAILKSPYFQKIVAEIGYKNAIKFFGLEQEPESDLVYGMPLQSKGFNFKNILARTGINSLMKGGFSSAALPLAAAGGLYYLARSRDPLNPNSQNYNPYLRDELNYLSSNNLIGTNVGPGQGFTRYTPDSVLQGKNVMSLAGSNSYIDMLDKYIANMEANTKISAAGKARKLKRAKDERSNFQLDQVKKELAEEASEVSYQGDGDGSAFDRGSYDAGQASAVAQEQSNRDYARGRFGQGGIASL